MRSEKLARAVWDHLTLLSCVIFVPGSCPGCPGCPDGCPGPGPVLCDLCARELSPPQPPYQL